MPCRVLHVSSRTMGEGGVNKLIVVLIVVVLVVVLVVVVIVKEVQINPVKDSDIQQTYKHCRNNFHNKIHNIQTLTLSLPILPRNNPEGRALSSKSHTILLLKNGIFFHIIPSSSYSNCSALSVSCINICCNFSLT